MVPSKSRGRLVIYMKEGVYEEDMKIGNKKWNLMFVGDGVGKTVATGDRNVVDGGATYRSAHIGRDRKLKFLTYFTSVIWIVILISLLKVIFYVRKIYFF